MTGLSSEDREALRSLANRYASGVDRRDVEQFGSVFLPDAQLLIFTPVSDELSNTFDGRANISLIAESMVGRYDATFHEVHQCEYRAMPHGVTGEVYCTARHFGGSAAPTGPMTMYIRYHDIYVRDAGGRWGIARREVHVDWLERTTDITT